MHLSQITPSLFAGLGLPNATDSLGLGESPHGRELLLLVDGLGDDVISRYASVMPKISSMKKMGQVRTSFPSTTSTSLATLTTGVLPGTHGMLGYMVQVPRSGGRVLNALKWDDRVDPVIWQPVPTLFERATAAGINTTHVAAKRYENTGFTQAVFRGATYKGANIPTDLVEESVRALAKSPSFVYLYVNDVDSAGHSDGVGSDKHIAALAAVDALVGQLFQKVPKGTRIWITSDHGMINVGEKIVIGQDNRLNERIAVIAGEPRARHLYLVQDSKSAREDVAASWRKELGERVTVLTREEVIARELFGPEISDSAFDRMGDLIVIAQKDLVLLDPNRADKEGAMVGHHGGDSDIESTVSLLTVTLS